MKGPVPGSPMVCGVGGWFPTAHRPPPGLGSWTPDRRRVAHGQPAPGCAPHRTAVVSVVLACRANAYLQGGTKGGTGEARQWTADIDRLEVSDWTGLNLELPFTEMEMEMGANIEHTLTSGGLHGKQIMAKTKGSVQLPVPRGGEGRRKRPRLSWRLLSIICLCLFPGLQVAAAVWSCVCCVDFDWDLKSWSQKVTRCSKKTWAPHHHRHLAAPPDAPQALLHRSRIV